MSSYTDEVVAEAYAAVKDWSKPEFKQTRRGPRWLCIGKPSQKFWKQWRAHKDTLRESGFSPKKSNESMVWQVAWWNMEHPSTIIPTIARGNDAPSVATPKPAKDTTTHPLELEKSTPAPTDLEYLPFQQIGIHYMAGKPRTLLADEMGLGKTVQALGLCNHYAHDIKRVLVVCPKTLKPVWEREANKWLCNADVRSNIRTLAGTKEQDAKDHEFTIINYDILHNHTQLLKHSGDWDLLVCDEAHYLKSDKARRTRQVIGQWQYGKEVIAPIPTKRAVWMTGTPVMSRPIDLWPAYRTMCSPEHRIKKVQYEDRYCDARARQVPNGAIIRDTSGASNTEELHEIITNDFMLRRRKVEVLTELPDKVSTLTTIDDTHPIAHRVRSTERASAKAYAAEKKAEGKHPHPLGLMGRVRHDSALAKTPFIIEYGMEILHGSTEKKLVVFAYHRDVLETLYDGFSKQGTEPVLIHGDIHEDERIDAVERFQTDPECQVFIGQITAAGVGITLTASSRVLFAELDWVPANVQQAEDRCHRIGQHNNVQSELITVRQSVDERLAQTLLRKNEVIEEVVGDAHNLDVAPLDRDTVIRTMTAWAYENFQEELSEDGMDRDTTHVNSH